MSFILIGPAGSRGTLASRLSRCIAATVLLVFGNAAWPAELKVLSAGAFKPVLSAYAPAFTQASGHGLVIDNDTAGGLVKRITAGEAFDVVVLPLTGLEQLVMTGKVVAGSTAPLARVGIGVAVKRGAPLPDISSVEAFVNTLLAARAVAMIDPAAGGTSGIYLTQLFETLGIADKIRPKAVLVPGGLVAQRLLTGEADIALHQVSEILAVPGATLVGPIPAAVQNDTVYAGGVSANARDPQAAAALLAALRGEAARAVLHERGMRAP